MPFTPEQSQKILEAIGEKLRPRTLLCPISGDSNWGVNDRLTMAQLVDLPDKRLQQALPLAIMSCKTCGYTMFVNLLLLGLGDEFGIKEVGGE